MVILVRDLLERCASNYPGKAAYICGGRVVSWDAMHVRVRRLAAALQGLGVGKGDVVAVLGPESIVIYEHILACAVIGAVRVGLNTQFSVTELAHVISDSGAKVVIVDARCAAMISGAQEAFDSDGLMLVGCNGAHAFHYDYETLLAGAGEPDAVPVEGGDVFLYSYTSGTTGVPKGVVLTHEAVVNVILHSLIGFGLVRDDVWAMPAASAWVIVIMSLFGLGNGMTTVIPDGGFDIDRYLDDVARYRVTATVLVPTMIQRLLIRVREHPRDLSSVRLIVYGSAPATPRLIREARAELDVSLVQTYGQTESTGGWMAILTEDDHRRGLEEKPELLRSAGRIGVHYECSIRDENGRALPPGSKGEIWLRGNSLMKGYLNLPEATDETLLPGGWLRSNDIGLLDEEGYLYLLDRQKFMIITGAVNVFPSAVEAVLNEHPAIAEVAVVGAPHPEWGEAVVAVAVVMRGMPAIDVAELKRFCQDRLSRAETPKHLALVDELPKTVNGKVRKAELRDWLCAAGQLPWQNVPGDC